MGAKKSLLADSSVANQKSFSVTAGGRCGSTQTALGVHQDEDTEGSLAEVLLELSGKRKLQIVLRLLSPRWTEDLVAEIDLDKAACDTGICPERDQSVGDES